jgi:uncharacterized protein (DUF302 family)
MITRTTRSLATAMLPLVLLASPGPARAADPNRQVFENGIVKVKSAYSFVETVDRIKKDVADKGIMFFASIDQAKLAGEAGIALRPSTLLLFGNPALGSQFITSNQLAGIDWPVRLLVTQDSVGNVWAVYNDFKFIARRHGIADRPEAFTKASGVIQSIASSVRP